jgi:hypothetical protein
MGPVHDDAHRFAPAAPHEDHVFGACSPGWHSAASHDVAVAEWVEFMQARDVERVCCLLAGTRSGTGESDLGQYDEAFDHVRYAPLARRRLVDAERLRSDILPFLSAAVAADERVVVHGLSGLGHTGQVLAAWLVSHHGYGPREAVDTVAGMGRDPTETVDRGPATCADLLAVLGGVG